MWRRIQVPERYSFWDLHVAIQDAMGWKDYHLHELRMFDEAAQTLVSIGIPTGEEADDRPSVRLLNGVRESTWHGSRLASLR